MHSNVKSVPIAHTVIHFEDVPAMPVGELCISSNCPHLALLAKSKYHEPEILTVDNRPFEKRYASRQLSVHVHAKAGCF